jgi:hypothetical protein
MSLDKIFTANDDANIDSERLLIAARNGSSFNEKNKIVFEITEDFVSLKNCYLHFDIAIDSPSLYKFHNSVSDIIKSIRITEKNTGRVIEQISNYNVLSANMYDYTLRSGKKNAKSMTELGREAVPLNGKHPINDVLTAPFCNPYKDGTAGTVAYVVQKSNIKQKVVVELISGLFNKKDETIYPSVLAPLQIEVELETNKRALTLSELVNPSDVKTGSLTVQTSTIAASTATSITLINTFSTNEIDASVNNMKGCPFSVNDTIAVADADGTNVVDLTNGLITSVSLSAGNQYVLGFASQTMPAKASGSKIFLRSASLGTVSYTVTDPAIEVCKVNVPEDWVNQIVNLVGQDEFRYNINAYESVPVNQTSANTSFVNYINSNAQSVAGVLTIPMNSSTADSYENALITGVYSSYDSYNYFYNGAPQPNLPVPLVKINSTKLQQQHLHELQKYYDAIGHPVRDLSKFKDNFCVARAMSVYNGSLPLTGRDLSCRFDCIQGQTLGHNILFNNYIYKNLQLVVNSSGVSIVG